MKLFSAKCLDSPLGKLALIASESGITRLLWEHELAEWSKFHSSNGSATSTRLLNDAEKQLQYYFSGRSLSFNVPLDLVGSDFQQQVWRSLHALPWGVTSSYGLLADKLGDKKKARVVGMALGRNPVPIFLPCHRIMGSNGSLGGFSGGVPAKKYLLNLEGLKIS